MLSALIALAARAAASPIEEDDPDALPVDDALHDELPNERPGAEPDDEAPTSATDAGAAPREDAFAPRLDITEIERVADARRRRREPTAWGRIDLSLAWRSTERDLRRDDEVWLVATWRR